MGVISKYFSLCKNFHSKAGMGVNSDMGVISREYGTRNCMYGPETTPLNYYVGTDPEDVIRNAFACFDEEGTGKISEDHLRELLTTMGDRFTDAEVPKPIVSNEPR